MRAAPLLLAFTAVPACDALSEQGGIDHCEAPSDCRGTRRCRVRARRRLQDPQRRLRCQAVIAFGGGSAIDAGKALAALAANGGDPLDDLEVIGRGRALPLPSLPVIAIPSPTPGSARCTASRAPSAACAKPLTARSVPRCSRTSSRSTCAL